MRPVEETCYWFDTVNRSEDFEEIQTLSGRQEADIAIVGAGFTGLWTAFFLKALEPSLSVAIVEQRFAGYGASGRNAGIISSCLDHSHALAVAHFGEKEAARLAALGQTNLKELNEFGTDCDFELSGQLQVALKEDHVSALKDSLAVASQLGIGGYQMLSLEETRAQLNSPLYVGALQIRDAAIINPLKLVRKLQSQLQQAGVRFFEDTVVTEIAPNTIVAGPDFPTPRAAALDTAYLKAKRIVLATDAYTHHLVPQLLTRFIPLYDYILVSQPLTPKQLEAIGWGQRQGVVDGRTFFNYYRLTADNRILWGTSEAVYYPANRVDRSCDHSPRHYASLRSSFARHFPQIADLEFVYEWGGPIASTTRLTPFFGSLHNGNTVYALGYTGHGILSTRVAGKILAHMALRRSHEIERLKMVVDKPFPYPPEPIRALAVRAVTHSLQRVDAGDKPNLLLKMLDALGIGFSS
jgi:glycine/D-amino acid oxidase-like deaminating enzyme